MRCLFCKADSSQSRSVEHAIPEALGNRSFVLPAGVVCDGCNNYFAVKVEGPLLKTGSLQQLRARQGGPSKRGRIMPVLGRFEDIDADLAAYRINAGQVLLATTEFSTAPMVSAALSNGLGGLFVHEEPPRLDQRLFSRLIAKIALELIAQRICHLPGWEEFGIDHPQFDPIRSYARFGQGPTWPVLSRRIYDEEATTLPASGDPQQTIYETDFFLTPSGEGYAVICLFGVEHTINLVTPSVEGYRTWLTDNAGRSPLYPDGQYPQRRGWTEDGAPNFRDGAERD